MRTLILFFLSILSLAVASANEKFDTFNNSWNSNATPEALLKALEDVLDVPEDQSVLMEHRIQSYLSEKAQGSPEAQEKILQMFKLKSSFIDIMEMLLYSVREIPDPLPFEIIKLGLADEDARVRLAAIRALSARSEEETVSLLQQVVTDEDPKVRGLAFSYLMFVDENQGYLALKDPSPLARAYALLHAGHLSDLGSWISLTAGVKDQSPIVRSQAAWSLRFRKDYDVVPILEELIHDQSNRVKYAALKSLIWLRKQANPCVENLTEPSDFQK